MGLLASASAGVEVFYCSASVLGVGLAGLSFETGIRIVKLYYTYKNVGRWFEIGLL